MTTAARHARNARQSEPRGASPRTGHGGACHPYRSPGLSRRAGTGLPSACPAGAERRSSARTSAARQAHAPEPARCPGAAIQPFLPCPSAFEAELARSRPGNVGARPAVRPGGRPAGRRPARPPAANRRAALRTGCPPPRNRQLRPSRAGRPGAARAGSKRSRGGGGAGSPRVRIPGHRAPAAPRFRRRRGAGEADRPAVGAAGVLPYRASLRDPHHIRGSRARRCSWCRQSSSTWVTRCSA